MAKGRPADPKRAVRGTGNRPAAGKAKAKAPVVLAPIPTYPAPTTLPVEVHAVWDAIVADLGGANHMRESYLPSLEAYCNAVYVHAQATANIAQYGLLVKGTNGPMTNPLLKVQKDAAATMLRYAETFGLTPAARIRLGLMEITGMSILGSLSNSLDGNK